MSLSDLIKYGSYWPYGKSWISLKKKTISWQILFCSWNHGEILAPVWYLKLFRAVHWGPRNIHANEEIPHPSTTSPSWTDFSPSTLASYLPYITWQGRRNRDKWENIIRRDDIYQFAIVTLIFNLGRSVRFSSEFLEAHDFLSITLKRA